MSVTQITCSDAFELLKEDKNSILIDVRTKEELNFVGLVDSSDFENRMASVEWKFYPDMKMNQKFDELVSQVLEKNFSGNKEDVKVLCLCRSGGRSDQAAYFLSTKGFKNSYNIMSGFEGDVNNDKHRGQVNGWKADNLPWVQS